MFSFSSGLRIYETSDCVRRRSLFVLSENRADGDYLSPDIVLADGDEIIFVRFVYSASFNGVA